MFDSVRSQTINDTRSSPASSGVESSGDAVCAKDSEIAESKVLSDCMFASSEIILEESNSISFTGQHVLLLSGAPLSIDARFLTGMRVLHLSHRPLCIVPHIQLIIFVTAMIASLRSTFLHRQSSEEGTHSGISEVRVVNSVGENGLNSQGHTAGRDVLVSSCRKIYVCCSLAHVLR